MIIFLFDTFRTESKTLVVSGIFSSCENNVTGNNSLARMALIYQRVAKDIFTRNCITPEDDTKYCQIFTAQIENKEFDVCNNDEKLMEIALSLNLDASYYTKDNPSERVFTNGRSRVILVLTFLSQRLQEILSSILLALECPLMVIFNPHVRLSSSLRCCYFLQNREDDINYPIHRLFKFYGWKSTSVIFITNNNESVHEDAYGKFVDALKNDKICFYSATIKSNIDQDFHEVVQKVKNQNQDHPKVLFGDRDDQVKFINAVESNSSNNIDHFWIGYNLVDSVENKKNMNLISIGNGFNIKIKKLVKKYGHLINPNITFQSNKKIALQKDFLQMQKAFY